MRTNIKQLLAKRPSWILYNDREYQDLKSALEYARKTNNEDATQELEMWLEQRKIVLLGETP
jgi:hypothetical protein